MSDKTNRVHVFGLVPAAGLSLRMGTAKQTLPYQNSTVTGYIVQSLLVANLEAVIVVTRSELTDEIGLPSNHRLHVVINDEPGSQMMDSILLGLHKIDEMEGLSASSFNSLPTIGVLVMPGDMPTVSSKVCSKCIEAFKKDPTKIVIATHQGKRGHPIVFPFSLRQELESTTGGLNELPRSHADLVCEVDANTPTILHDVDTPSDYDSLPS